MPTQAPPRRPAPAPQEEATYVEDGPNGPEWVEPLNLGPEWKSDAAPIVFHLAFNGLPCDVPVYTPSEDGLRDFLIAQTDWLKSVGFTAAAAAARPPAQQAPQSRPSGGGGYQRQGGGGYQQQRQAPPADPNWQCPEHGYEKVSPGRFDPSQMECGVFSDYQEDWTRDKPSENRTTGNLRWYCRYNSKNGR